MDTEVMSLTSEQILQIPELAHLYEAVRFLENKTGKELFPKKYEASMLSLAERDAHALFRKKSDLTIKEALLCILNEYPSEVSGEILLKMTQKIIQEWEAAASRISRTTPELEPA